MGELELIVRDSSIQAVADGSLVPVKGTKRGEQVIIDWLTQMAFEGRAYQVIAGSITTPLVGDVVITDTAAEMSIDPPSGRTVIPVEGMIGIRLGTGTLHEYAIKSVGAVSTVGDAFVPLPLRIGGAAATSTARVDAAGGVTVSADVVTTTRQHWHYANPLDIVTAGGGTQPLLIWVPRVPPILVGPACLYCQIAATGTGPSYYVHLDFIEIPSTSD